MIKEIEIVCSPGQQEDEGALKNCLAAASFKYTPRKKYRL